MTDSPSTAAAPAPRSPWPLALLVAAAMGLLHMGVGLVLTRSSRGDLVSIEQTWTPAELAGAEAPGGQPEGTGIEIAAWTRAQRLWNDAERHAERRAQVRALQIALWASFALQAGFVGWLALRAGQRRAR